MSLTDSSAQESPQQTDVPERGLSIAEAARRSGVTADTLRYYERSGMMPTPPGRTSGGSRRYWAVDLRWIRMCTKLRATGMPIRGIRRFAELLRGGPGNECQVLELLESHRAQLLDQMATFTEHLELIDHKIGTYRERVARGQTGDLCGDATGPVTPRG